MKQTSLNKPKLVPTLRARLDAIEAELNDAIDNHCGAIKKQNPSVPLPTAVVLFPGATIWWFQFFKVKAQPKVLVPGVRKLAQKLFILAFEGSNLALGGPYVLRHGRRRRRQYLGLVNDFNVRLGTRSRSGLWFYWGFLATLNAPD